MAYSGFPQMGIATRKVDKLITFLPEKLLKMF